VTGLEAALAGKSDVTHNHDALYQQKYGKVAVVAQTGGDYIDPVAAMNNLATWCGTPSATNPCLLKIMPGVYTLGNTLMIASYVDVEGSGANSTKIVGTVRYEHTNNNELRMLTVESAGTAIEISSSSSLRIRDASIVGVYRGIDMAYSGNVTLSHVDISVSSATGQEPAGISSFYPYGDVLIEDCMISASGSQTVASWGFRGSSYYGGGSGNLFIKNSKITATPVGFAVYAESYDIFVNGSEIKAPASLFYGSRSTSIANTMLDGPSPTGAKCFGAYDGNYNPVVCQ
jgi:hypothetical protein